MTGIIGFSLLGSNICNPIEEFSSIPKAHTYLHLRIRAIQLIRKSCNLQGVVFLDERWRKTFLRITCIVAVALLFFPCLSIQRRTEQIRLITLLYYCPEYNPHCAQYTHQSHLNYRITDTTLLCVFTICSLLSTFLASFGNVGSEPQNFFVTLITYHGSSIKRKSWKINGRFSPR